MKSTISVFLIQASLCMLALTAFSFAQNTLTFGLKGGVNFATQYGDTYSELGFRNGIVFGAFVNMPYSEKFSLQGELNYTQDGARNANYDFSDFSTVVYDQKLQYDYIALPAVLKYHLKDKINLQAGVQLGIRVLAQENRKIKSGEPSPTDNSEGIRNLNGRINLIYPSMCVGAEYQLADKLNAQVRVFHSIFDNVKAKAGDSEGTYPFNVQFTVSYDLFDLVSEKLPNKKAN